MEEILKLVNSATITLPATELCMLLVVLTGCLLFEFNRVGLLAAYLFIYRWGWLLVTRHQQSMLTGYLVFGCVIGVLAVIAMVTTPGRV